MSAIRLHCFAQSGNAYKVALMLRLCDLPFEPVFVDFFNGATRGPDFRGGLNEMGEAPVLEHEGRVLTQSGAILRYLADLTGKFDGQTPDEKLEVLRWILFDNHKFTANMATYRFLRNFGKGVDPAVTTFFEGRVKAAYAIAEKHLATRDFIALDRPTIADLSMVGYLYYPSSETGIDLSVAYPAIARWCDRIAALPGWEHPYRLMPGAPATW